MGCNTFEESYSSNITQSLEPIEVKPKPEPAVSGALKITAESLQRARSYALFGGFLHEMWTSAQLGHAVDFLDLSLCERANRACLGPRSTSSITPF